MYIYVHVNDHVIYTNTPDCENTQTPVSELSQEQSSQILERMTQQRLVYGDIRLYCRDMRLCC